MTRRRTSPAGIVAAVVLVVALVFLALWAWGGADVEDVIPPGDEAPGDLPGDEPPPGELP